MSKRFLHMADVHLGYKQYHLKARATDIARAFKTACLASRAANCDFVLVAGDLFNAGVDATTFLQAILALPHGIPLYVIPGNHDRPKPGEELNWLHALAYVSDVTVLEVGINNGKLDLTQAVAELDGIRIVGIPYLGTGLAQVIPQIAEWLSDLPRKYTILMMHAGLDGEMPHFKQPLTMEDLAPLRDVVDYVALGHLHKPYERDNWVFNPGSLEALSVDEIEHPGGWYLAEAWDHLKMHEVEFVPYAGRRPFERLTLDVSGYETAEDLRLALAILSSSLHSRESGRMRELTIDGRLRFPRASMDLAMLTAALADGMTDPLRVWVRDMTTGEETEVQTQDNLSRTEMEHDVLMQLVGREQQHADQWAEAILELKERALQKATPDGVIQLVQTYNEQIEGKP